MMTPNSTRLLRWTPFAGSALRCLSFSLLPLAFGLGLTASAQQVAPLQFSEIPAASSFFTASVTNAFDGIGSALADDWTLEAETGDRLTVRIEAAIGNSSPRLRVLNPSGQTIVSVDGSTSGIAESYNTLLSSPGTYRVRVYSDQQVSNYRLRVDLSRGPTLEIEPNNSTNQANFPNPEVVAGSYRYRVAAALPADDSAGDFYNLGVLDAGNAIAADIYTGPTSTLQPGNAVFSLFQDGQSIPILTTNQSFSFVVPAHGLYFAQVSSATNRDLFARYFLTLTITDSVAPSVLAVTLPPEGATSTNIINSFDVTFSEPMAPASVNNLANYSLRNAGPDTVFNTADDQVYPLLSPAYVTGTAATFALADGPLQPGNYRLTISSLVTDRAGNPLTPAFTRNFTIERLGLFQFENRTNDSAALATSLSLNPLNTPDGSFQALATYPVGSSPYFVLAARFNADTNVDLAVANINSGNVSILLGNGDNTFQPATNFAAGSGPIALATGDLNGDGRADLVVANYYGASVSVLLGNGDGTFSAPTNYSVGSNPRSVMLGDLNHDGKLDLVTANSGSGNITVRLGNGDGTFQDAVNIATGSSPYGVALGQLNGDSFLDIVVANAGTSALSVLLGNGDGTFAAPSSLPVGNGPRSVVISDLNGDGKADLACVNGNDNTVSVLFGNGDGTFAAAAGYPTGSSDPYQIIVADVDADGHPDLVVANYSGNRVGVFLNNGAGGFYSPANYNVGGNPISVVAADLNGDGRLELATANYGGNNVTVLTPNPTQLLAEDPLGSGIRTGAGRGNLSTTSDVDYWSFSGRAGDRLVVASETPGNPGSSGLYYRVERPDGGVVDGFYANANGTGQLPPVTLPISGTYVVRVSYNYGYSGEYRIRVTTAPPIWQLESEDNNDVSQANTPAFTRGLTNQTAKVLSYIRATDPGDVFGFSWQPLGRAEPVLVLSDNTQIALVLAQPATSALQPILEILNSAGTVVASAPGGNTNLTHTVQPGAAGRYYGRVRGASGTEGLFSQYLLTLTETIPNDVTPPQVVSDTLPAEGAIVTNILDRFTLAFSEELAPATVNNATNYDLRAAGPDNLFGNADDVLYSIVASPAYANGTNASFLLTDGPLQPGHYRLTVRTNLQDISLNPLLAAYVRTFFVTNVNGFVSENRTNDSPALATSLSLNPLNTPDGSFQALATYPVGAVPYFILSGRFNADTNVDLAVANYSSGYVSILLGNGDNTFQPATNFATGSGPIALATGDLNGDGRADLVVANYNGASVSVLLGNGDGTFSSPTNYSVGSNPRSVVLGDLNHDGKLDLVTANSGSGNITVRLGNGDGTFQSAVNIATGNSPFGVALGQLTGDGFPDIVVANAGTSALSVLLGNGDGTFAAPSSLPVGNGPRSVVIGDLNGDGKADLACVNASDNTVSVLFGNGDGTFAAAVGYATGSSDPYQIIAADVDADGHPDLLVANYGSSRLGIFLNDGEGGFYSPANYSVGNNPISVVAADLNGDGRVELATANYSGNNVTVLTANPTQLLAEDPPGSGIRTGAGRGNLSTTSDVDYWSFSGRAGDRLVVASETPGNPGSSGLYYRVERPDGGVVDGFYANANGTGQLPPVTLPISGTYVVRVSYNYGYSGEYRIRVTTAPPIWQLESEDNNGVSQANVPNITRDGTNQWAKVLGYIRATDPGDVYRLQNLPPNSQTPLPDLPAGTQIRLSYSQPASSPFVGILEILNNDGTVLAAGAQGDTNLLFTVPTEVPYFARIRAASGTEGLFSQYLLNINVAVPQDVQPPQITADTLPAEGSSIGGIFDRFSLTFSEDMLATTVNNSANYELRSAGNDGLFGTGDDALYNIVTTTAYVIGTNVSYSITDGPMQPGLYRFTARTNLQDSSGNGMAAAYVRNFSITNVNGFVFENRSNDSPALATSLSLNTLNTPDGSFQALATYPVGAAPYFILSGRFNADASPDLAVANINSGNVSILLGNGDNTFQPAANFSTGSGPIALATGDLNGDGKADLVVANYNGASVSVLLGNGDGTFTAPTNYSVGNNPHSVVLGDLNNDGKLDLVTANYGSANITVRLGNGDGTFRDPVNIATGNNAFGVALGQLNGDGFLDIVVANAGTSALSVLLGNGDGTFAAPTSLPVGNGPRSVVIRDLNGDGKADLACVNGNDNTVSVLFGNGDGTFAAAVGYATGGSDPYQIIAADADADGHPDLLVANYGSSRLSVFFNNGAGGFYSPVNYNVGNNPISVVAADLNGDGRLELATANYGGNNVTVLTPNPTQLLAEDPPGSGIRTGAGRGNLSTTSDVDYWSFSGRAGDRLVVASETPGNAGSSGLYYRVERPDGGVVDGFYANANGTGQLPPVTLPNSGTYVVRVSYNYGYSGEYRIRVTTAPPIWQLESEDNNGVSQANTPAFTLEGNRQWAKILGYIRVTDPGDVFQLGNLSAGTSIGLSYAQPGSSGLAGILEVLNSAGTVVASQAAGTTNLTYTVPAAQADQYYARIRAQSGTEGLFSQYLLSINLFDTVPPTITADTLPPDGSTLGSLFNAFSLSFSEDMLPATVNNPNSYDLRSSGPDGLFDTVDDVLQPITLQSAYNSGLTANYAVAAGALQPGAYRFTARTNLQDRAGNAMAAAYVRQFTIAQVAGLSTEIEPNNTSATATALPITSTQPNLFSGGGRGYLANSGDVDFWSFNAQSGDVFVLTAQIPGNPGNSGLQYILYSPSGAQLFSVVAANNGLLQTDPLVLTDAGTFTVRISQYYGYYSEYRLRASLYRGGLDVEREPNDSIVSANALTFTTDATNSTASVVGTILVSNDLDYFNLGTIQAGKTVFLKTRQPGSSPLISVVSVYNAANTYMPEAGSGRPSDAVAEVQITQTGTYYAAVRATADSGGLMSEYILDVLVVPTTAVSFPNLQVTQLTIPVTTGLKSGDPLTVAYTVANVGSLATQVGTWFDRVVLSTDSVMDDADLQLGLYQHNGVLQPGQSYSLTNTVNLPDGISGPWYVIAKTDFTDNVNEFILEGDNETATDTPLNIVLAKYPDLVIENFHLNGPDPSHIYTVTWDTFNRGMAVTPGSFNERLRVRNQTTATTVFDQTYTVTNSLGTNASVSHQDSFTSSAPGQYLLELTTDSSQQIFEYNQVSHASAEANTVTATFAITRFDTLTLDAVPPQGGSVSGAGSYPEGASVTVTATPNTSQAPYYFVNWIEAGIISSASASYTFNINQDLSLTAVFALPTFQVTASNNPPRAGSVIGAATQLWGTTNSLAAQPAFGYKFSNWTENGVVAGTSPTLVTVVYSNRFFVANYAEANLLHAVTTATAPPGVGTVAGAGTYTNGQSATISAPAMVTNAPSVYAFQQFTLNGSLFGTNASFLKTFATTDPTNMAFVAEYQLVDLTPPLITGITVSTGVVSATVSWTTDEPAQSHVEYGLTSAYGTTNSSALLRTQHNIALSSLTAGTTYHFRVRSVDAASNTAASSDRVFTTLAAPDLVAGNVSAPAAAQPGDLIPLRFAITNIGPGPALGAMQNAVLMSTNANGSNAQTLGAGTFDPGASGLAAGASITVTQSVIVPSVGLGPRYLGIQLDSGNQLFELRKDNNTAFAAAPLNIIATDLRVARVTVPGSAVFSQSVPVTFVVTNAGTAPASIPWNDGLYLSTASNVLGTLLATVPAPVVPLAGGASYTNSANVTLPLAGGLSPGLYYIVLAADQGNAIAELIETNNLGAAALNVSLPPLPDFAVASVSAPANAVPGQSIQLIWAVTNQGTLSITGSWSETVFLATNSVGAGAQELATFLFTNSLPVNGSLSRTQSVVLPTSVIGNLWLAVAADSRDEWVESNETNNLTVAPAATVVPAELTLQVNLSQVSEGASQPVIATVTRNGSIAATLTVALANGDPTELSMPTQVVIPAGQASVSFNIQALLDGLVRGPQTVTIGASAPGYTLGTNTVTVLDVDLPRLAVSFASDQIIEGTTLTGTLSRDSSTSDPAVVTILSSIPTQLQVPASVIIPAGVASVQFPVTAIDDTLVEPPMTVTVNASAPGYLAASTNLTILDNDWPTVTLTIAPDIFSEGAGPQAALATLTRSPVSSRALDLDLESSNPNALTVPTSVTIPAGQTTITFSVAAVNNNLVDGPKDVLVRVWFKATGTSTRLNQGTPAHVTVTDDDGPTLQVSFNHQLVAEGQSPAATGIVTRNTATTAPLVVALASSNTNELTTPVSVTIPAGATSAPFDVASINDGVTSGNQVVTVTASAAGFTSGSSQITVTDINLPDLVVSAVTAPATAETEAYATIGYTILNQGLANAPSNAIAQRIYLSPDPVLADGVLIGQYTLNAGLPAGSQFSQTFQARMPQAVGQYWVIVQTDVLDAIVENNENNNVGISAIPIQVVPAYNAEVSTTLDVSTNGTTVPLAGRAYRTGNVPSPYSLVSIYIRVRNTTRIIAALTDINGNFATTWQPLAGEAGFYEIAACHPGITNPPTQDSFQLLGMKAQPPSPSVRLSEQSSAAGTAQIQNLSDLPLTGLSAQILSKPANLNVVLNMQTNYLAGDAITQLAYGITANDASITYGIIQARVTTAEGVVLDVPITVQVDALVPRLVSYPSQLQGGMKRGVQRLIEFQLVNNGGLESGPITVSLPPLPWMSLTSPNPLPSLAPGATNKITLQLTPPADLPLTIYNGNLALNGPSTGLSVPFSFRALSEAKGSLQIASVDEFTYYAAGAPPLTNAAVALHDSLSGSVVTNAFTDSHGLFLVNDLPEGYYDLDVSADQHNSYHGTLLVEQGATNDFTAFLSYQAVRYTWTVERIEVEDRYQITVETTFEVNVPAPVVTISPAVLDVSDLSVVGQTKQVNMTFENHGLIAVDDMKLNFGSHPFYSIEPLITDLGRLGAKSTLTIPIILRRIGTFQTLANRVSITESVPCGMGGSASWDFECGPVKVGGGSAIAVSGVEGDCGGGPVIGIGGGFGGGLGGGGGGGSGPGGSGSGVSSGSSSISIGVKLGCDPTCLVLAALGCIPGPIGCAASGFSCGMGLADGVTAIAVVDCAVGAAGCLIPGAGLPSCIYSFTRCFITPTSGSAAPSTVTITGTPDDMIAYYKTGVRAELDAFNQITGAPDGVWLNPQADSATGDWFARFQSAVADGSDGGRTITAAERSALLAGTQPPGVAASEVNRVLDRWNRSLENFALGILRPADAPPGANLDFIDSVALKANLNLAGAFTQQAQADGFTDPINAIVETVRYREATGGSGGTCARVTIKLDQEAVLSRDAFRATLDLDNATANPLSSILVTVRVTDGAGTDATTLFGIRAPDVTGMSDVNGGGAVPGGSTGSASWTIIPTVDAAPSVPKQYFVSGQFDYTLNGVPVSIPLSPVAITVYPTPRLTLDYFHDRNVYADDPHTDVIEPSIPFNLAIMVRNNGAGEARDFSITSAQPQIVDNEKGLLIDFKIIATEVAGQNLTPTLTANFGTIPPGGIVIGRWLMTSTLQGLFTSYSATFEHIDSLGNPKLSVIDEVRIHEMIKLVQAGGAFEDGKPDFLVNDRPDLRDLPDTLWLSDGSSNAVQVVTNATITGSLSPGNLQVQLTASMPGGWTYLRIPDPGNGQYRLVAMTRSDSVGIRVNTNVWVTDRTFIGQGTRPINENILNLLDYNSTGSYTLVYQIVAPADTQPPTSQVAALPAQSRTVFPLSWSGTDAGGSGVANYDIYFSENSGPFQRWLTATPTIAGVFQGDIGNTYAFYSVAVDQAGNREAPHGTPDAQTTVTFSNRPPVLAAIPTQTVVEGDTFSLTPSATDPDGDAISFQLGAGAPPGIVFNSQNGQMSWITGEANGPGTNSITLTARDNGFPQLSSSQTFQLIVLETNSPPTLAAIPDVTISEGALLTFTNVAVDSDLPPQKLTFSLDPGAPLGASVNPTNGVFTWKPSNTQGGKTNLITVRVTDDGPATLSATQTFAVIVLDTKPDFFINIGSTAVLTNAVGAVPLSLQSGISLTNLQLIFSASSRLTNLNLSGLAPQVGSANLIPLGSNRFDLRFESVPAALLQGNLALAQLGFTVVSNNHSAVAVIATESLKGARADNVSVNGSGGLGKVFIVGPEPILDIATAPASQVALTLYAHPSRYALERNAVLGSTNLWSLDSFVNAVNLRTDLPLRPVPGPQEFFRAYTSLALTMSLSIRLEAGQVIIEWPQECLNCSLEKTSALKPAAWLPAGVQGQLVNGRYRVVYAPGTAPQFLRLIIPSN